MIDQPEKASEILGVAILDYRGANEDVRPVPVIGQSRARSQITALASAINSSIQPQRSGYGWTIFLLHAIEYEKSRGISHEEVTAVFGTKFILQSSIIRPHWRSGTDFSKWSGKYPGEKFIYELGGKHHTRITFGFNEISKVDSIGISMKNREK